MLKTPNNLSKTSEDPILSLLADVMCPDSKEEALEPGFMTIAHFSSDMLVWGRNSPEFYMGYPDLADLCSTPDGSGLKCYGVCDTPKQFIDRYKKVLEDDPVRTFFCTFTHVAKDPSNKGYGGGWRWHKWGPYIGDSKPYYEYLDDEEGFDEGVWVYHVLQIEGPEVRCALMAAFHQSFDQHVAPVKP